MAPANTPRALERLGPFRILRPLARGGMSEVYLGRNDGGYACPDTVVLKVWRPPSDAGTQNSVNVRELLARLIEEGRLGTRLRHPNITRSYGVAHDKERDLYFLIQDYVDGVTLSDLMDFYSENDLRLPYNIVLRLASQILYGLHYAYHDALREDGRPLRVVHRDIKPDNVMLGFSGEVQLLDFGVARSTSLTRQVTVGDFVVGTRHYMAPEQVFEPTKVGHRSDLFSVGLILFELCALRPVFPRTRAVKEFATALMNFRFVDYEQLVDPRRYPGIREVLAKVLVSEPAGRYAAAGEFAADLEKLLEKAPAEPSLPQFATQVKEDSSEAEAAQTMLGESSEGTGRDSRITHHVIDAAEKPTSTSTARAAYVGDKAPSAPAADPDSVSTVEMEGRGKLETPPAQPASSTSYSMIKTGGGRLQPTPAPGRVESLFSSPSPGVLPEGSLLGGGQAPVVPASMPGRNGENGGSSPAESAAPITPLNPAPPQPTPTTPLVPRPDLAAAAPSIPVTGGGPSPEAGTLPESPIVPPMNREVPVVPEKAAGAMPKWVVPAVIGLIVVVILVLVFAG